MPLGSKVKWLCPMQMSSQVSAKQGMQVRKRCEEGLHTLSAECHNKRLRHAAFMIATQALRHEDYQGPIFRRIRPQPLLPEFKGRPAWATMCMKASKYDSESRKMSTFRCLALQGRVCYLLLLDHVACKVQLAESGVCLIAMLQLGIQEGDPQRMCPVDFLVRHFHEKQRPYRILRGIDAHGQKLRCAGMYRE